MKKIISLFICLTLLLGVIPSYATVEEDAVKNEYQEAVETLVALKILEGDGEDLMLDKILTRAEFVTLLVRTLGAEFGSNKVFFEDVTADHWAASQIGVACALGIVQGKDDKTFAPDEPLAIEEAMKMLVCALGYEPMAKRKGGYPSGYMAVAHELHLLENTSAKSGLLVKRNIAAQIIFNTLDTEIVIETGFTADKTTAKILNGSTLLYEKLKIEKGTGIVTANEVTSLSLEGGVGDGLVKIGDTTFKAGETNAADLLGYNVTYYADCSGTDDVKELLFVRINENKNDVTIAYSRDILPESSVTQLAYRNKNDKKVKENISSLADILYNGMGTGGMLENIIPTHGYVQLIDNNLDGAADVVFVYDFQTIIADIVNSSAYLAYDSEDSLNYVELDPESRDYVFSIFENGVKTGFESIVQGSVLSVAESTNTTGKKQITVLVSNVSVTGRLEAIGDETIIIDETEYKITEKALEKVSMFNGKEATFSINAFGEVAGVSEKADSFYEYGYLMDCGTKSGLSRNVQFRVLAEDGKIYIFDGAEKISLDGGDKTSAVSVMEKLYTTVRPECDDVEQLIRFRRNGSDEIIAIDTTATGGGGEGDKLVKSISKGTSLRYMSGVFGNYGQSFTVNDNTKVFIIPKGSIKDDENYYKTATRTHFIGAEWYDLEGYDMNEAMSLGACILDAVENINAGISASAALLVIEQIRTIIDVDGTETYKITGKTGTRQVNYVTYDSSVLTNTANGEKFKVGDMVRLALNTDGRVIRIQGIVTGALNEVAPFGFYRLGVNEGRFFATISAAFGVVTVKDGMNIVVDTTPNDKTDSEGNVPFMLLSTTPFYVFDVAEKTLRSGSADELMKHLYTSNTNSRVAVGARNGSIAEVIIYNFD